MSRTNPKHPTAIDDGVIRWQAHGYFSNIENALKELVNQEVRDTDLKDIRIITDRLNEVYDLIENATLSHSVPNLAP